jgi:sulfoxide reductase catalytic subunit YedY
MAVDLLLNKIELVKESGMNDYRHRSVPVEPSEITPEHVYHSRRKFLEVMGIVGAGSLLAACAAPGLGSTATVGNSASSGSVPNGPAAATPTETPTSPPPVAEATTDELGDPLTPYEAVTNFNNYYEFTTAKEGVASLAADFNTSPWQVEVGGLVHHPRTFGLEDILKLFPQQERVYRLRCVEAWSMVIPWQGFPLSLLLKEVEPTGAATHVRFETVYRPDEMRGQRVPSYPWPYQEGLRLDEAMHDLAILATGLYGAPLPVQNGAPVRLVVPWKYGFKSIKAIVKIELVDYQPDTLWSTVAPNEYGFYSNVNPEVSHPRWSQASERRIGESGRRPTLMFNGYAEEVAELYAGMDLREAY